MTSPIPYVAGDADYRYPEAGDEPAPVGATVLILTEGGVCRPGIWRPGDLAWSPYPKRNREKEERIRAIKSTTR